MRSITVVASCASASPAPISIRPVDELQPEVEQLAEPGLALGLDDHVPADLQREIARGHLTREVSAVYRGRLGVDRLLDLLPQLAIPLTVGLERIGGTCHPATR